jgi:hypothetical protein
MLELDAARVVRAAKLAYRQTATQGGFLVNIR